MWWGSFQKRINGLSTLLKFVKNVKNVHVENINANCTLPKLNSDPPLRLIMTVLVPISSISKKRLSQKWKNIKTQQNVLPFSVRQEKRVPWRVRQEKKSTSKIKINQRKAKHRCRWTWLHEHHLSVNFYSKKLTKESPHKKSS